MPEDHAIVKCIGRRRLEVYVEDGKLAIGINLGDSPARRIATPVLEKDEAFKLYKAIEEKLMELGF